MAHAIHPLGRWVVKTILEIVAELCQLHEAILVEGGLVKTNLGIVGPLTLAEWGNFSKAPRRRQVQLASALTAAAAGSVGTAASHGQRRFEQPLP